jgi:O-antigen/teichoic acid export membrane protein
VSDPSRTATAEAPAPRLNQGQRILKNAVVGVGAGAIAGGIEIPLFATLARYLGVAGFGTFSFVIAFVRAFQHFGDLGLRSILLREIAVDRKNADKTLAVARGLVWLLSAAAFLLIVALIQLVSSDTEVIRLTYLAGLALITILHANAYGAVCRAFEEMEYNAIGHVLERLVFFVAVLVVVWMNWGLQAVFVGLLLANLTLWGFYYVVVRRNYLRPWIAWDFRAAWTMAKEAVPVGIGVILRRITWSVDIVLLAKMVDVSSAGLFAAAYRIPVLIHQLSVTLSHPFAPVYAKLAKASTDELSEAYANSFKVFWALGVPITVGLVVFANRIIRILFGPEFAPAAAALQIQSIATLFLFPTSLYVGLFTALGQQRLYMMIASSCLAVNVVFDVLLIPWYSFIGASIGTALAEMTFFGAGLYCLRRLGIRIPLLRILSLDLVAGAVLGVFVYQLRGVGLVGAMVGGVAGLLLYGALLLLLGAMTTGELALIWQRLSPWRAAAPRPTKPVEG